MNENGKIRHEWIPLSALKNHPTIQRDFSQAWADAIAAKFDPDAFGELYVSEDGRSGYLIWDGQHRAAAARKALGEDQLVYCRVHPAGEAIATLAARSLKLNNSKRWMPIDRFMQRVSAGDWKARAIHGVLHQYGLRVEKSRDEGVVQAVVACDWIIDTQGGQPTLDIVIRVLFKTWGKDPDAYHHTLLRGVGMLMGRYNGSVDEANLIDKLGKSGGPGRMIGRIRDFAKTAGFNTSRGAVELIRQQYNKGRQKKTLPPWRDG